ncbi:hypothetical protein DFH11DRAFT_1734295 [Phellopilus nigrolimitatus]|nr:hypothetical protein DFH11DRAFT_1734295 [Phellopilus nigrolimitatus]
MPRLQLSSDLATYIHIVATYDTLLEQNLLCIVEPYSVVQVEHVAEQVKKGQQIFEAK